MHLSENTMRFKKVKNPCYFCFHRRENWFRRHGKIFNFWRSTFKTFELLTPKIAPSSLDESIRFDINISLISVFVTSIIGLLFPPLRAWIVCSTLFDKNWAVRLNWAGIWYFVNHFINIAVSLLFPAIRRTHSGLRWLELQIFCTFKTLKTLNL